MRNIEEIMRELATVGVSVLITCDGQKRQVGGDMWMVMVSGGPLLTEGAICREGGDLDECFLSAMRQLRDRGGEWHWVDRLIVEDG